MCAPHYSLLAPHLLTALLSRPAERTSAAHVCVRDIAVRALHLPGLHSLAFSGLRVARTPPMPGQESFCWEALTGLQVQEDRVLGGGAHFLVALLERGRVCWVRCLHELQTVRALLNAV